MKVLYMSRYSKKVVALATAAVVFMFCIERFMQPTYIIKSIFKILLFAGTALLCLKMDNDTANQKIHRVKTNNLKWCVLLGIGTYLLIIAGYFLLSDFIDAKQITDSLLAKENITASNFIFVAVYISFVNSLLEEMFFRGLMYLKLSKKDSTNAAFFISALMFSIYHIGIMTSWFSPVMFAAIIFMLFVAGLVLNIFCRWCNSFAASWIIHIAANLSINTIGFIMLLKG